MSTPNIEDIYEDWGDELGSWMGVLIDGHVDDDTAVAMTWAYMVEECRDDSLSNPRRRWVRKVPRDGRVSYCYTDAPGRGARAVTIVETSAVNPWQYWCDAPGCRWQFVPGSARSGVPRATISNADEFSAQQQYRPGEYLYLCRDHCQKYEDALRAARIAALAALSGGSS